MARILLFNCLAFCIFATSQFRPNLRHSWEDCQGKSGEYCKLSLLSLKPTQTNVGVYEATIHQLEALEDEVQSCQGYVAEGLAACYNEELKDYLQDDDNLISVVYGYDKEYYITDGHHHAYAIWLLYHNHALNESNIPVYVHIEKNYNNNGYDKDAFWAKMIKEYYFWPYGYSQDSDSYGTMSPDDLPGDLGEMGDDPYRSIFGIAREDGFSKPSGDKVGFYQFKWAACATTISPNYHYVTSSDGSVDFQTSINSAVNFLTEHGQDMVDKCTSDEFNNMPNPSRKEKKLLKF